MTTRRDARRTQWTGDLERDMYYALRQLFGAHYRGVTLVAIAALAVSIGASTAMFGVLDAVVLQPLPFPQQERLVVGWKTSRTDPSRFVEVSYPEFLEWRAQSSSFESLAALPTTVYGYSYILTGRGDPVAIQSARVSHEFFEVLGVRPFLGRTFEATDDRVGALPTVVLTHPFWTNVLGADPEAIGAGLTLTGVDFTVIGVLPAGFVFPQGVDVFTALGTRPGLANNRTAFLRTVGRLRPGVSKEQAISELGGIVARLEAQRAGSMPGDEMAVLTSLRDHVLGSGRLVASSLFAGAVVLLLVAGANLSGVLAARAAHRGGEVALRLSLGASTGRLLRQFVAEGLVLATIGSAFGLGLAVVILDAVIALAPDGIARITAASIDGWAILFAVACLVVVTLVIGCAPLMLIRDPSIHSLLRGGAAGLRGGTTHAARVGPVLVTAEVVATVALLIIAGALTVSFVNLRNANTGFAREGVLTAFVNPNPVRYPDATARRRFFRDVLTLLEADPRVESAGAALLRPLEGPIGWDLPYALAGQRPEDEAANSILNLEVITPSYFEAIGTPLLAGRAFSETDVLYGAVAEPDLVPAPPAEEPTTERLPLVAIVSESVAREMYGSVPEAVGQRFIGGRRTRREYRIVGVVADGRYRRMQETSADVFLPYSQTGIPLRYVVVRTSADPGVARSILRRALAEVDPEQPMSADLTTTELVDRALSQERFQSALLLPFGLGSAALAAIGVFGIVSDAANRRLRELALRQALGATPRRVLGRLLRATLLCVLAGEFAGALLAVAAAGTVDLTLFETTVATPGTILAVCFLVLGVALVACIRPAARVVRQDIAALMRQQ